ncbi:MAG: Dyp-type peroxidase [Acidocella sp.]|nr:Dyp-type peroxidase [Acidocella sp.]
MSGANSSGASRRTFFGLAGGLATAAIAEPAAAQTVPFHGAHQAGITTPMQDHLYFASFDLAATKREDVVALLKSWTDASARLTAGQPVQAGDSGEAEGLPPSGLTLTFGFGPELFLKDGQDRYGLAAKRPAALVDLPRYPGDQLVPGISGGALCVQACANDAQVAFHAVRQLARLGYGAVQLKWVQSAFATARKTPGTPRNLMGFKDGTMNPAGGAMDKAVWVTQPGWMQGGSYMVARRIRIALEHWDRMQVAFQEKTFGREKASGAPLGGRHEFDKPDFNATDANGDYVIPETAHARLAAAVNNDGAQILRRSYSYNDGANFTAERWPPWHQGIEYDAGLFFQAYQQDPRTGFMKIFDKMSKMDALNQFTTHVSSAVFACPPGVRPGGYIGQELFEAA